LGSKTKQQLIELGSECKIEYIDIPFTAERYTAAINDESFNLSIEDRGDYCCVEFSIDGFQQKASPAKPFISTSEELKIGIVQYFKDNRPELLECHVEHYLSNKGHQVLWTPPYSPDLQPIKLFWAAGKNHAANYVASTITMRETVANLRKDGMAISKIGIV
jgi:transposase